MRSGWLVVVLFCAGTHASADDALGATLASTAGRLVAALPEDARREASFPFDDDEREDVRFAPLFLDGARVGELPEAAASLTDELLAVSLSPRGVARVRQIRQNELAVAEKDERRGFPAFAVRWMRDPGRYFLAVFGEPAADAPWGFRFEGHHLSLNLSVAPGAVPATTPLFLGAEPRVAPDGARVLGDEEAAARALLTALPPELRARATLVFADDRHLLPGQVRRVARGRPAGATGGEPPPEAQAEYDRLIELFAGNFAAPVAAARVAEIDAAGRDALRFAWAAPADPANPRFYWRLSGPRTLIEMDNTTDGDHVHAVWHDPRDDFGDDLLAAHLRAEHGLAWQAPRPSQHAEGERSRSRSEP